MMGSRIRLGYTLTELVVVSTIIVVVAAMVVPNVAHMKESEEARDLVPSIQQLVTYAREKAISEHTTAVLTYEQSTTTLTVKQDATPDQNAPTVSAISASQAPTTSALPTQNGAPIEMPKAPTPDPNNPAFMKTVVVPPDLQLTDFQVAGKTVSEPDFKVRFYSDGTCDSGGIGFGLSKATQCLTIDDFGRTAVLDGPLPDPTTQKWEAGQFEPRSNVQ